MQRVLLPHSDMHLCSPTFRNIVLAQLEFPMKDVTQTRNIYFSFLEIYNQKVPRAGSTQHRWFSKVFLNEMTF
jgi:hypothetical protein